MKRILITGASRGIGRAIALRLAGPETTLILTGRNQNDLNKTAAEAKSKGASVIQLLCDLADPNQVQALVMEASKAPLDVLINNAGVSHVKPVVEQSIEDWNDTIAVNITAPFLLCRGLIPVMSRGASIVNINSSAGRTGFGGWSSYCMSKFALDGFSKSIREELRAGGIRVISVFPSATDTEIWNDVPGNWPREQMMKPESVADAVAGALAQPPDVLIEELVIGPIGGRL
ncbi:MAG: SDR family NAD(P)-dependent oxidoreductase [Candidatus Zixiibacteriota bacterium]